MSAEISAIWCNECRALRGPNGEPLDYNGKPQKRSYRCGVEYPGLHSHLDVVRLVPEPCGSGQGEQ